MRSKNFKLSELTDEVVGKIRAAATSSQEAGCKAVLGAFESLHCLSELTGHEDDAEFQAALVGQLRRRRPRLSGFIAGVKNVLAGRQLPKLARAIFQGFLVNLEAIVDETSSELDDLVLGVLRSALGVEPAQESPVPA